MAYSSAEIGFDAATLGDKRIWYNENVARHWHRSLVSNLMIAM